MTPNNLHGHTKNIKWGEIYCEQLDNTWKLIVTLSKEYSGDNFPHVCIKCVVTNGKMHTWGNGAQSFMEHTDGYWYKKDTAPEPLKFTTKDGFICEQFVSQESKNEQMESIIKYDWKTNITPEYLIELTKE